MPPQILSLGSSATFAVSFEFDALPAARRALLTTPPSEAFPVTLTVP
jgi:hypothetical protein